MKLSAIRRHRLQWWATTMWFRWARPPTSSVVSKAHLWQSRRDFGHPQLPGRWRVHVQTGAGFSPAGTVGRCASARSLKDQQLEVSIDGERVAIFNIIPRGAGIRRRPDDAPIKIKAGPRRVSVVFLSNSTVPVEDQYWLVEQTARRHRQSPDIRK